VVFRVRYAREMATFEVQDSGPGILPEEADDIFEPYARGSAASGSGAGGTGLGLPICRMLVQLMGGQLTLATTPGGTTFTVRMQLPRVHAGAYTYAHAPARVDAAFAPTGYLGPRRRILVVDHERVDRELLVDILAPLGFDTMQADTGAACMRMLSGFQPDLILMDRAMPALDVPILVVSANAWDKTLESAAGVAQEDFIAKPVHVAELLARIGVRLALEWTLPVVADAPAPVVVFPPALQLDALRAQIALGYVRGVQRQLDDIAAGDASYLAFADALRQLAAKFDLDAMTAFLDAGAHNNG
jgi:CheY-like chemotaxis protein